MPYFSFAGTSRAPVETVVGRLRENVGPVCWFFATPPDTEFMGSVTTERFTLERVARGRQRFDWSIHPFRSTMEPLIRGHIRSAPDGTVLEAWLTFRPMVWGILVLLSMVFGPKMVAAVKAFWQGTNMTPQVEPYMLTAIWLWAIGVFYLNAFRVKRVMLELLDLHAPLRFGG
jgi:hypothetical protein